MRETSQPESRRPTPVWRDLAIVGAGFASYALQLMSVSDPKPGYVYLSPSLTLAFALVVGTRRLLRGRLERATSILRDGLASGTVFAASVFWLALVPVNGLPPMDDWAALVAAITIHAIVPVLAVVDARAVGALPVDPRRESLVLPSLVAAYGLVISIATMVTTTPFPYEFMSPSIAGWPFCIVVGVAVLVCSYLANWALLRARLRH